MKKIAYIILTILLYSINVSAKQRLSTLDLSSSLQRYDTLTIDKSTTIQDGIMHVNPQLEQKGLALFFNPTDEEITRTIKLPLYYTGLDKKAYISEHGNRSKVYKLNRDYTVDLKINIPANGYTWYVIE